jgi:hypothetical protein
MSNISNNDDILRIPPDEEEEVEENPLSCVDDFLQEPEEIEGELVSYAEILAAAILNDEVVITIPMESEERVKNGIKGYKSKQATKNRKEGQPIDNSILSFMSRPSKDFLGYVDLSVISQNRGVVRVKKMSIPENDLPD